MGSVAETNVDTMEKSISEPAMVSKSTTQQPNLLDFLIPKDAAAWLEFLAQLVKKRVCIAYLSDKELKNVINRARPNLSGRNPYAGVDPDEPLCFSWTKEQVAEWIGSIGFPHLKGMFLDNYITGSRLVTVDASALCRMGMRYLDEMKEVTSKIRHLLGIHKPNMMRALACLDPYELYLRKRVRRGYTNDQLTFEQFSDDNGFDWNFIIHNRLTRVACMDEYSSDSDSDADDFRKAPSVEVIARRVLARNQAIRDIIENVINAVFLSPPEKLDNIPEIIGRSLERAYSDLALDKDQAEKMQFAQEVAEGLWEEMMRTAVILEDLDSLDKDQTMSQKVEQLREAAEEFMNVTVPIAALLATGELSVESILKRSPTVTAVVDEAISGAQAVFLASKPNSPI